MRSTYGERWARATGTYLNNSGVCNNALPTIRVSRVPKKGEEAVGTTDLKKRDYLHLGNIWPEKARKKTAELIRNGAFQPQKIVGIYIEPATCTFGGPSGYK
jgi:hypothetical protein